MRVHRVFEVQVKQVGQVQQVVEEVRLADEAEWEVQVRAAVHASFVSKRST